MSAKLIGRALPGVLAVLLSLTALAQAAEPADTVREHFLKIAAEDYTGADQYFSAAFRRAFKGDFAAMDRYYLTRRQQLGAGYAVIDTQRLADRDRETVRVTVEFNDADPESIVLVSERLHYYLVREKAEGALQDRDGMAWRIDIFDALAYDTLAEARRRPYLYTREAWPEDESRELKAQQGLYRVQQALESFKRVTGQYPLRLLGADNRRDELISGKYLTERYPACGFDDRPMEHVEFGVRSSGDFSYYSYDGDGDGALDGYWLLLHGKVPGHALFSGRDAILILADGYRTEQPEVAAGFAQWWEAQRRERVAPGPALGGEWPAGTPPESAGAAPAELAPEAAAQDAPPVVLDTPAATAALVEPASVAPPLAPEALPTGQADATGSTLPVGEADASGPEMAAPVMPLPVPGEELIIHSWGF